MWREKSDIWIGVACWPDDMLQDEKQQCPTEEYLLLVCTWSHGGQVGDQEKSISLLWDLDSIFMLILWNNCYCFDHQHCRHVMRLQTKNWWIGLHGEKNYIMIVIMMVMVMMMMMMMMMMIVMMMMMIIIIFVLRDEHKMVCKWDKIILLWFSKVSVLSSPNALFALALSPLGGSFVTLTLFCNTVTGKLLVGMELKNKRKSSCTSASGDERFLIVVSIANIQEAARWQFWKNTCI